MKALAWLLMSFAAAVGLTLAAHNPGYVQLVYPPWRIELSLTLFVVLLACAVLVGHLLLRLLGTVLRLPQEVRRHRSEQAGQKAHRALLEAVAAFFEGCHASAEKAAVRAMELGEDSGLASIIAARAAHEQRAFAKRDAYLMAAEKQSMGNATLRLLAQAEFLLQQKQPAVALETLHALQAKGVRNHVGVLNLELKAQQQVGNWEAVLDIITQLEKRDAIDSTLAAQLRQQAWLEKLRAPELSLPALRELWQRIPADYRRRARLAAIAARQFLRLNDPGSARQLLTESLNAQWDSTLVKLYGDCGNEHGTQLIEQAERWLQVHPDDAALLLALGKLSLRQGLWGKAQSYLDASIGLQASKEGFLALAQLAEQLGQPELARRHLQQAMELPD